MNFILGSLPHRSNTQRISEQRVHSALRNTAAATGFALNTIFLELIQFFIFCWCVFVHLPECIHICLCARVRAGKHANGGKEREREGWRDRRIRGVCF